ncbi:MAG: alpha/beta fold hydrolase [Treponema sp.]
MKYFFRDRHFEYQVQRAVGAASAGQADTAEVIEICRHIRSGDCGSWYREWKKAADRIREFGVQSLKKGYAVTASESFLRAASYYRAAEFYLYGSKTEEVCEIHALATKCFNKAAEYMPADISAVCIPFEGTTIAAHFYRAQTKSPAPTVIAMTGNDGTKEELYAIGTGAVARGMHCIAFDGPGQGESYRLQGIPFRYNYETVIKAVIDYLVHDQSVDKSRIVLWGESMGGYFAPRAAAFEKRIAACIANSGLYDCLGFSPATLTKRSELLAFVEHHKVLFNNTVHFLMKCSTSFDWRFRHGCASFGVKTPADYFLGLKQFCLSDTVQNIKCPVLVTADENEVKARREQPQILYNALSCPKTYLFFSNTEGAGSHCEQGCRLYANGRIFNWIEKTLSVLS